MHKKFMKVMNSQVDYQPIPNIHSRNEILLMLFQLLSVATGCIFIIIPDRNVKRVIVI
jgi:hypothetical protein